MRTRRPERVRTPRVGFRAFALGAVLLASGWRGFAQSSAPPVLSEIDRTIRDGFFDPRLKGVDWPAAVARAAEGLSRADSPAEQDAVYDRLLAVLADSHTFRVPAGRLPESHWATAGLRIGQDGEGYAVKGVVPGSAADRADLRLGDRILEVDGRKYGPERVNFRDLFFVFEGAPGSVVSVVSRREQSPARTQRLIRTPEEPGDALVWKSARLLRRDGRAYGYAHLWGMSADTALAIVDMLLDRDETARVRPQLSGWGGIEGFLLDARGNSGGYDPNILTTFLRGLWSAGDYYLVSREGRRLSPPVYRPLPVALLVNSGTASSGESLALKFRAHAIGPIVGETTAGMASGGAAAQRLSDGSMLWYSARAIEGLDGRSYEGRGVAPDVAVADRPPARPGEEDAIVEAGLKALATAAVSSR
jgi:C-terminal processing protease CtpA/Prc